MELAQKYVPFWVQKTCGEDLKKRWFPLGVFQTRFKRSFPSWFWATTPCYPLGKKDRLFRPGSVYRGRIGGQLPIESTDLGVWTPPGPYGNPPCRKKWKKRPRSGKKRPGFAPVYREMEGNGKNDPSRLQKCTGWSKKWCFFRDRSFFFRNAHYYITPSTFFCKILQPNCKISHLGDHPVFHDFRHFSGFRFRPQNRKNAKTFNFLDPAKKNPQKSAIEVRSHFFRFFTFFSSFHQNLRKSWKSWKSSISDPIHF